MPSPIARELRSLLIGLLAFAWLISPISSRADDPASAPTLRVETGMHTAQVSGLSADPKGRWIVTGSDDKTVRVWETATGRLLKTLRPPIGDGAEGKIYAVAVSPDGNTIACGGYTNAAGQGGCLYLFDRASGQIRQRIVGLPNVTLALAYSPDGHYLAAGLGLHGLSVFHADGTAAAQDGEYKDSCYGVAFDKSGRLATASLDGYLRLYDTKFQRLARKPAPDGRFPFSAAFSPDGTQIAVGYYDTPKVSLVSSSDLTARTAPDTKDITNGSLRHVAWSPDGRFLYAAGTYQKQAQFLIRRWMDGGSGTPTDLVSGAHNTVAAVYPLTGSAVAWSGASPSWGLLDGTTPRLTFLSRAPDFSGIGDAFRLSDDGSEVQYQDASQSRVLTRFSLVTRILSAGSPSDEDLSPPKTQASGLDVTDWNGSPTPKLGGKTLTLAGHEASCCLAIAPGGRQFILGTTEQVRCYDSTGALQWKIPAPEISWAVNVAGNGKVCAAAFGDGTIHWYRMSDGQEQLALFPDADRKRWLAWTTKGFYDCSPGGEDFIGWHINRGWIQSADFFPAGRFRSAYDRPAVIAAALGPLTTAPVRPLPPVVQPPSVTHILPPVIRILSPEDGAAASTTQVTLRYTIRTPSGEPTSVVHALIDGRPVIDQRDLHIVSASDSASQQISVTIPMRDCEVSLIAQNRYAPSEPAVIRLKWQGTAPAKGDSSAKPKLYVLAIGVSKYHDPSINLQYGASDASDFANTMLAQNGSLYRDVQEKVLTDGTATKANILAGLQWIRTQTTGKDVAMIFIAGHGANDPDTGSYLFIPQDFNTSRPLQTAVPYTDIKATVQSIPGKALFFIDTCHAGNVMGTTHSVGSAGSPQTPSCAILRPSRILAAGDATPFGGVPDVTSVINELSSAENGVVVFSASTGNQVSFEDSSWGHGAFTKALVEAMTGGADYQHTGRITVNMLDLYLSERVKALTKGAQTPTTTKPETVPDFPVAVLHT